MFVDVATTAFCGIRDPFGQLKQFVARHRSAQRKTRRRPAAASRGPSRSSRRRAPAWAVHRTALRISSKLGSGPLTTRPLPAGTCERTRRRRAPSGSHHAPLRGSRPDREAAWSFSSNAIILPSLASAMPSFAFDVAQEQRASAAGFAAVGACDGWMSSARSRTSDASRPIHFRGPAELLDQPCVDSRERLFGDPCSFRRYRWL